MTDDGAPDHSVPLPEDGAGLPDHFPDGGLGNLRVVYRPGKPSRQDGRGIFHVRQVDIHQPFQLLQRLHPLIAAAVINHRNRKLWGQGRNQRGQKLGGSNKIDVFRSLADERFHCLPQLARIHRGSHRAGADGPILAVAAAQCAAAEEDGSAAPCPCQGGLFPFVDHGFGHQRGIRAAAYPLLSLGPVHAAHPGAEGAIAVVHIV